MQSRQVRPLQIGVPPGDADLPPVVQIGPGLSVRGGVSSVERLIIDSLQGRTSVEHIATMTDSGQIIRLWVFLTALHRLRALLREEQTHVFHVHFSSRGSTLRKWIIARMVLRTHHRLVLHAHGGAFDAFFTSLPEALKRLIANNFRNAHGFIALSSQWQDFYAREFRMPLANISVLVNPAALPSNVPDRSEHDRVQFLFMGRIGARKGAFALLDAYQQLPSETRARTALVFAGDGRVGELRELALKAGPDVTVHSWLEPAARDKILAASDVLVLPSQHEGVPMAILEAMAFGLPVVATPVGGIPDVVSERVEGLFVDVGDVASLTSAMVQLVEDPTLRRSMGAAARARAETLSINHYVEHLVGLYRQVAVGRP